MIQNPRGWPDRGITSKFIPKALVTIVGIVRTMVITDRNFMTIFRLLEMTDASVAAQARNLADSYRSVFPTAEECFFAELKEGVAYTITCGLAKGLKTTVRYRAQ